MSRGLGWGSHRILHQTERERIDVFIRILSTAQREDLSRLRSKRSVRTHGGIGLCCRRRGRRRSRIGYVEINSEICIENASPVWALRLYWWWCWIANWWCGGGGGVGGGGAAVFLVLVAVC
jgi:hypothetical protein